MRKLLLLLLVCVLQLTFVICYAQNVSSKGIFITGTVVDASGEALPGVSILLENSSTGTITNILGEYSIQVPDTKSVLSFSFLGYTSKSIKVNNQKKIDIVLEESTLNLDEVVVVGYGTQRRADLTGSVSSVGSKQLKDIPVSSAAQAIVGKLPGVQISQSDGSPDAEIKIRVRGGGSITQDNSPLYIVDGFPVERLSDITPSDIATVDVLKDASSTAIYGARGANGVVIITTKSGSEGFAKISYNMYCGVKNVTKKLEVLDPYEYVYSQYELQNTSPAFIRYFGEPQDFDLYKRMKATDWQEEIFGRTGTSLYNNLSVSGGTKLVRYNVSLTRDDEKEIMLGSGYTKTNLSVKTNFQLKKWLKLDLTTRISNQTINGAGLEGSGSSNYSRLPHVVQYRPVNGLFDFIDPTLVDASDYEIVSEFILNPLNMTEDDYRHYNRTTINVNSGIEFTLSKKLKYRAEFGAESYVDSNDRFWGTNTSNAWSYGKQPLAEIRYGEAQYYRMANILTYDYRNFLPKQNLKIMLGEELYMRNSKRTTVSALYFPEYVDAKTGLAMMNLGTPDPITTTEFPSIKSSSFFGRLNYDYKGIYILSATLRADGSSKFASGNRWGYFPSVAAAWRISDEKFLKNNIDWLSNLKVRLSYGQAGNNRIGDDLWKKSYNSSYNKLYIEGDESTPTIFLQPSSTLSNPRLKWETTTTRNIGLDFGIFRQRLSGTIEYYNNITSDLLIKTSIPKSTGYSYQYQNIGQTSNRGVEISLEGVIIDKKDFKISASFNIGFNKNRIDKLGDAKEWLETSAWTTADGPTGDYLIKEGGEVGLMYGYETDGMYTFDDFTYDNGVYTLKPGVADNRSLTNVRWFMPGALKFKNQDDNPVVDANDKVVVGNANPKHTGGFSLNTQYKGFDFSAFFNWVYGNDIYNANKLNFTNYQSGRFYKNLMGFMNSENRFTYISKETGLFVNDPTELAAMNANATIWSHVFTTNQLHSWAVEDGSFLRLNNLTIGYSLPEKLLKKINFEQIRLYLTGYNLFTWTKYTGYDPEVDSRRSSPLTPGVDWSAYPRSRSFNMGINITF